MPSFDLNRKVAAKAEEHGFEFLLSMVKLRSFGGSTEFWDHNLESFTLMAGLAAVTSKIQLYASVALPTMNPAMVARMASTIDDIPTDVSVSTSCRAGTRSSIRKWACGPVTGTTSAATTIPRNT